MQQSYVERVLFRTAQEMKRIYIMMESKFRASLNGTTLGLLAE